MKEDFKISVITPFYKGNAYLPQLFTVIQKNYENLTAEYPKAEAELILVNDSPSVEVTVPDVPVSFVYRILKHEVNSGIHQGRVTGLHACTGDYVIFLDQDDVLEDETMVSQVRLMEKFGSPLVICNAYMEEADGSSYLFYQSKTDVRRINDLEFYIKSHNVIKSPGQCLIRKDIIPEEWTQYIMHRNGSDDLFLWILLLEKSFRFTYNEKPLYIHKYTGENLSDSETRMGESSLEIVDFLKKIPYVPEKDVRELKKAREFSLSFYQKNTGRKIKAVLCNLDLFCYLAVNKIKKKLI